MKTLKQIRDKIIDDLDLEEETFVDEDELNELIKDGVRRTEATIHTLYEDYFLSSVLIPVTSGTNLYDFPPDIYANKVRMVMFTDGTDSYEVKRVKNLKEAVAYDLTNDSYVYNLTWYPVNNASDGRKIRLFPSESDDGTIEVWYIRNAKTLINDDDVCDIDEFVNTIEMYVKTQVYLKDGDPRAGDMSMLEKEAVSQMTVTLSDMIIDEDNEVEADYSFYMESV